MIAVTTLDVFDFMLLVPITICKVSGLLQNFRFGILLKVGKAISQELTDRRSCCAPPNRIENLTIRIIGNVCDVKERRRGCSGPRATAVEPLEF